MRIRQAASSDVDSIAALVAAAYEPYVERIGRKPAPMTADYRSLVAAGEVRVALVGDEIVGVLVIRPVHGSLHLENVAVQPGSQGHGYGRALIAFAEAEARRLGLPAVTLYTNEAMTENLELYPRLGYVEAGRRHEQGYRRVYFEKRLDAALSSR